MTRRDGHGTTLAAAGWCPKHGKRMYPTRRQARDAIRQIAAVGGRAYRCTAVAPYWHWGHIPEAVRRGHLTAREIYTMPDPLTSRLDSDIRGLTAGPPIPRYRMAGRWSGRYHPGALRERRAEKHAHAVARNKQTPHYRRASHRWGTVSTCKECPS